MDIGAPSCFKVQFQPIILRLWMVAKKRRKEKKNWFVGSLNGEASDVPDYRLAESGHGS